LVSEAGEMQPPSEFAYESDLRDFLAKNLSVIEPGLQLYQEEGITGVEFPAGGRFLDILAVDAQKRLTVIELKVSRGYDRVIGQILRYMAWIEKYHAEPGQPVRGIIVAREISEDLKLACSFLPTVSLYEYELSVALRKIELEERKV
jgi:endonuclease